MERGEHTCDVICVNRCLSKNMMARSHRKLFPARHTRDAVWALVEGRGVREDFLKNGVLSRWEAHGVRAMSLLCTWYGHSLTLRNRAPHQGGQGSWVASWGLLKHTHQLWTLC